MANVSLVGLAGQLGKWWNIKIKVNPTQVHDHQPHPVHPSIGILWIVMRGLIESFSIPFVLHYVAYRNGHLQKCAPRVTAPSTPDGESASRGFREESAGSTTGSAALHSTPGEEDLLMVEGSQQGVSLKSRHGNWFSVYYREPLIFWVRGSHFMIASLLKRSQQQHITPYF